jgi:hypothetical protein
MPSRALLILKIVTRFDPLDPPKASLYSGATLESGAQMEYPTDKPLLLDGDEKFRRPI